MRTLLVVCALLALAACEMPAPSSESASSESASSEAAETGGLRTSPAEARSGEGRSPDAEAIHQLVEEIFVGMRAADGEAVRALFDQGARFAILNDAGSVDYVPMDGWIEALGQSGGRWDERVYDVRVEVDASMASAWAPYTFYLDGQVSHCGINTLELLETAEGWKVTQVSDTRYTEDCPDPLGAAAGGS